MPIGLKTLQYVTDVQTDMAMQRVKTTGSIPIRGHLRSQS